MQVSNNYNINQNFKAKFLKSESMDKLVEYAINHNKFDKLNQARKNIDTYPLSTRLRVDIYDKGGMPAIKFTRFEPKRNVLIPMDMQDYVQTVVTEFVAPKKQSLLKFAFDKIIKLGNSAPDNKMYQNVVIKRK